MWCVGELLGTSSMTTGDLKNNLRKLQTELRAVKYSVDVDFVRLTELLSLFCLVF